jgi:hypothetical protein
MHCHSVCVGFTYCEVARLKAQEEELARIAARKRLEDMCDEYLLGLHCTLWGQAFNVIHSAGRKEAVAWLADLLEGLADAGV